ncbi:MAG: DUF1643 domain-containing protein [Amylibacter sp.]|jgi:hypothetical protein|nr:DUF1643 domain-containing protein [Amylibacter sp.]
MITRTHNNDNKRSTAIYSDCENYRYSLTRTWDANIRKVLFIMLNPSTATEIQNDPTVERCERRARALGYGAFQVCNIFAYRATDPHIMRTQNDPNGPDNSGTILEAATWADDIVCAWGTHGAHMGRGVEVETLLREKSLSLTHLGLSKAGHPKHPLYISYSVHPEIWKPS